MASSQTPAVRAGRGRERSSSTRAIAATALAGRPSVLGFSLRDVAVMVEKTRTDSGERGRPPHDMGKNANTLLEDGRSSLACGFMHRLAAA